MGKKIVDESSTNYLYSKVAAYEINKFNPEAKIIAMFRNPVEFLYSLHSNFIFSMYGDITDFKEALNEEEKRKSGESKITSKVFCPSYLYYSVGVKFTEHSKRFLKYFLTEIFLVIFP